MSIPKWAADHLYADELALLQDPPDWANPTQVLLLRLAEARYMTKVFERTSVKRKSVPVSAEDIAWARKVFAETPPRVPHDCEWVHDPDAKDLFPRVRCRVCRSSTSFLGSLREPDEIDSRYAAGLLNRLASS